jgi:hypothetical protein
MFPQASEKEAPMHHAGAGAAAGDGKHHHEIHEDDGGGFMSKHTHPDGHIEHGDHVDYDEAKGHMDKMFGHGSEDDDGERDLGDGMDADDIAGSYGRSHDED